MSSTKRREVTPSHAFEIYGLQLVAVLDDGSMTRGEIGCAACALENIACHLNRDMPECKATESNQNGLVFIKEQDYIIRRMKGGV